MSKRKRTTADEKRTLMLQFFHEKREFYTLKELETEIPKECGFPQQSVKDVLQELVDDGLIHSSKIGTSIYFWCFPGERIPLLESQIGQTGNKILTLETKLQQLKCDIDAQEVDKENLERTKVLLKEIEELNTKESEIRKQILKFKDADPEVIAEINQKAQTFKDNANIWTDNIFSLKTWCNNKFGIDEAALNKQFRIPEDLDYIE